jgi:hypothetical protein
MVRSLINDWYYGQRVMGSLGKKKREEKRMEGLPSRNVKMAVLAKAGMAIL